MKSKLLVNVPCSQQCITSLCASRSHSLKMLYCKELHNESPEYVLFSNLDEYRNLLQSKSSLVLLQTLALLFPLLPRLPSLIHHLPQLAINITRQPRAHKRLAISAAARCQTLRAC